MRPWGSTPAAPGQREVAWVYLDDQFPDHPKVVAAGDAAAWLFVCGLAYCRRYNTAGRIPKGQVAKLTASRSPAKLAKALLAPPAGYEAGLWEDHGDHYLVHDYDEWNKPQASRSEAARKAAKTRWGKQQGNAPPDADAHANAYADASETHSGGTANGDASGCPPPKPPVVTSPDNSRRLGGDASDDDDAQRFDQRVHQAVVLLAKADLDKRQQAGHLPPLGDPHAWLREAITRRSERNTDALVEMLNLDPDASPEQLADALEPVAEPRSDEIGTAPPRPPEHVAGAEPSPWLQPPPAVLAATRQRLAQPEAP